jgi:divalent metal cation (Fe/Co/Zn/Cd) transporter
VNDYESHEREMTTALVTLIITIIVGILASVAFNLSARSWFPMQIGARSDRTSGLVAIAGAFMGLHIGMVVGLTPWPLALYLAAFVGTFVTMWGWHRWM